MKVWVIPKLILGATKRRIAVKIWSDHQQCEKLNRSNNHLTILYIHVEKSEKTKPKESSKIKH